ncbi:MAG: hypothetical protein A3D26_04210 [Candidatus Blackburnbacteria bacterium RIFCSPHIGHO2_02_FULL_44_20]|uniref:Uncharacterized protein n=1 Tax=Candidatus Blackburnbacteria bacterium RIFCSPHIGHO2_02_FULL_44_20 TaxID=1797516 RepID=A0A1G1V767_9BACT|nr:MAG: hypothetical protein A3E16_03615 [Candidatus Blackburnbacteria bacterium RIFCSPHIGHO2_12_FULL_44_25]OGY11216.1 MAG: hypothetical protein A3D26_04210 [Candidatus Blackburnbacteria bacterium RIFCSPHIGHO2_02_FULL_44_20]OGY14436.1 MAG: hypothetical protein A3A62_00540 [Candidatus Blackburnbacteria bacterium RIFCSPLOWO2_01_FULL_44_43]
MPLLVLSYLLLLSNNNFWGLGFSIVQILFVWSFISLFPQSLKRGEILFYLASSVVLSAFLALRAFEVGRLLVVLSVYVLNSLSVVRLKASGELTLKAILAAPILVFLRVFREIGWGFAGLFRIARSSFVKQDLAPGRAESLFLGGGLAVFLVVLFAFLFSSADPVFSRYVGDFLGKINVKISPVTVRYVLDGVFFFGLFSSLLSPAKDKLDEFSSQGLGNLRLPVAMAVSAVSLVTGLFLVVQAQHLFAGAELLAKLNISHSEYTRRGFAELVVVSSISLILLWVLVREHAKSTTRFLSYVFLSEVALLLGSVFYRVWLYQDTFGFTQARLLGAVFALWLGGVLATFLHVLWGRVGRARIPFVLVFNTVMVVFVLNLMNIDYLVGAVKQPNLGYRIDHPYVVSRLSTDAWPGWQKTLDYYAVGCQNDSLQVMDKLGVRYHNLAMRKEERTGIKAFGAWNLSNLRAYGFLKENYEKILSVGVCTVPPVTPESAS